MADGSFPSAKLREFIDGRVKRNESLYPHTGLVAPEGDVAALLSFAESVYDPAGADVSDVDLPAAFGDTEFASVLRRTAATERLGTAVSDLESFAVGVTDRSVEIGAAQAVGKLLNSIYNERAPYVALLFGATNSGKTGFAGLLVELWREVLPMKYGRSDGVVVSNLDAPWVDHVVRDFGTWRDLVLGDRAYFSTGGASGEPPGIDPERPVWWLFDECSTHLDARTMADEVSSMYLPAVKRFAKVRVDGCHIGHSTMDVYKDLRRQNIASEVIIKESLKTAAVYEHATEVPSDLKYTLEDVPKTLLEYDPDDYSPWSWHGELGGSS